MPSTMSSSVSSDFASSTVMTPSLPTFFIASASIRPISVSPLAEMVPGASTVIAGKHSAPYTSYRAFFHGVHPTQQFAPAALNAGFAQQSGHPPDRDQT